MSEVTPFMLRRRPDQTSYTLNNLLSEVEKMKGQIAVTSTDKKNVIIIGNQPTNPTTGRPYSFGIHTYRILGDRLEEIE